MSLIAGIYSRNKQYPVPASACKELRQAISRQQDDRVSVFTVGQTCYLAKVDIGAYGEPAERQDPDGSVSLLAGEPLLAGCEEAFRTRTEELDLLHQAWRRDDWDLLQGARGVFCGAHYEPTTDQLSLFTDKLGMRPIYYWADEKYVIFATALRILESLTSVPKQMDVRSVTEMVSIGVPIGNRSPYVNIACLRGGEVIQFGGPSMRRWQYWRWDLIQPEKKSEPEHLQDCYDQFVKAVARRLRGDTTTAAFLSGGLDSRCIVAAVRARGVRVHTFNFAMSHTQEQYFAAQFAEQAGTIHQEVPLATYHYPNWSKLMSASWSVSQPRETWPAERPGLVWSGAGGCNGFGHVHVYPPVVKLLRSGQVEAAITQFLDEWKVSVPKRLLRSSVLKAMDGIPQLSIREQLERLQCSDPGRAFHLYLLLNHLPAVLSEHFETLDLHRLELHLPMVDSDFVRSALSVPLDLCLGYRFYHKWLDLFPAPVKAVPWQAYPGHEPCPLPIPEGLAAQWDKTQVAAQRAPRRLSLLKHADTVLHAGNFPTPLLRRRYLQLASLIYRSGLRDCGPVIEAARTYHRYWSLSGGKYALPSCRSQQ